MKKVMVHVFAIAALIFASCSGNSNKNQSNEVKKDCCVGVYSPKTVLDSAEALLDKQIKIKANVTHVCHCSGKDMVFTDMKDTTVTLRVLAGGEIAKFNECLVGQHANITGYLRVNKITKADLDSSEAKMIAKIAEMKEKALTDTALAKRCNKLDSKLEGLKSANLEKNQWMEAHQSEYYPDYYFEAEKFADCCKKKNDPESVSKVDSCDEGKECESK